MRNVVPFVDVSIKYDDFKGNVNVISLYTTIYTKVEIKRNVINLIFDLCQTHCYFQRLLNFH